MGNILRSGERLEAGKRAKSSLYSQNGVYFLVMQGDGGLCVYYPDGKFLWGSGTGGHAQKDYVAVMQKDGGFCVYDPDGKFVWGNGTGGHPPGDYFVELHDDGKVCVYQGTPENPGESIWCSDKRDPFINFTLNFSSGKEVPATIFSLRHDGFAPEPT